MSFSSYRLILGTILVIVLCVNIASFSHFSHLAAQNSHAAPYPVLKGDSENYVRLSDTFLSVGVFGLLNAAGNVAPDRHWPPGYTFFLASTKWISGGFQLAVALQIALCLGAVGLIYLMALRYLSPLLAALPAFLYGIDPSVILANTVILSDSIFSSLLVACIYLAFFYDTNRLASKWLFVGLLLGVITLIRPISQFLIMVLPAVYLFDYFRTHTKVPTGKSVWERAFFKEAILPVIIFVCAMIVVVAPWMYRNYVTFGIPEIAHVKGHNLLYYNAQDFLAWKEMNTTHHVSVLLASRYRDDPAYAKVGAQIAEELKRVTPAGESEQNYNQLVAQKIILSDPLGYAYFHIANMLPFFLGSSVAAYMQSYHQVASDTYYYAPTALALFDVLRGFGNGLSSEDLFALIRISPIVLEMAFWVFVAIFSLIAVVRYRTDIRIVALGILVLYFAFLTSPVAIVRYRIPAEPYLFILATIGIVSLIRFARHSMRQVSYD